MKTWIKTGIITAIGIFLLDLFFKTVMNNSTPDFIYRFLAIFSRTIFSIIIFPAEKIISIIQTLFMTNYETFYTPTGFSITGYIILISAWFVIGALIYIICKKIKDKGIKIPFENRKPWIKGGLIGLLFFIIDIIIGWNYSKFMGTTFFYWNKYWIINPLAWFIAGAIIAIIIHKIKLEKLHNER
jgi:hypothetical protein